MATLGRVGACITPKQGKKMSARPQFIQSLSKDAVPGRTYRLYIPKVRIPVVDDDGNPTGETEDNFMLAYVVGRDVDFEVFNGVSFMTYDSAWHEMIDVNSFKDLVGVDSYQRIMRAAFEAACEKEKADAEKQAQELAEQNGGKVDERALFRKLDNIEMKYHGRKAEDGVPAVPAKLRPAIGGLRAMLITECLRVPMKVDTNTPDWANAVKCYRKCGQKLLSQIIDIMENPAFNRADSDYIELLYKYGADGQEKSEAGRDATFTPISADLSLEVMFPESWNEVGKQMVADIAGGAREGDEAAQAILKDSGYSNIRLTPQELASTVKKWAANNLVIFTKMNMDARETQKAAKDLVKSGILDGLSDIKDRVIKMTEESDSDEKEEQNDEAMNTPAETMQGEVAEEPVSQERQEKMDAAMKQLREEGAIDAKTANEYLNIPEEDGEDLMGDLV